MIFAQIPQEAILKLKGQKFQLFAVIRLEEFEGGGACQLCLKAISKKYPALSAYTNLTRIYKEMVADGWLVETPAGIKSGDGKKVAKNATIEADKELRKTQQGVAKNATNGCEKRNFSSSPPTPPYKDNLEFNNSQNKESICNVAIAREAPSARSPLDALSIYREFYPHVYLTKIQTDLITVNIRDGTVWRETLELWIGNDSVAKNIKNLITAYEKLLARKEAANGKNIQHLSEREQRELAARKRIEFDRLADEFLEREGIIQVGGP
jgi:hypothetical protein